MRIRTFFVVAALIAAPFGAALGQQSAATPKLKTPPGLSFAFDAPHGQLTATGYTLNVTPKTADSSNVTGKIEISISIDLVSKFPPGFVIPCSATVIGGQVDPASLSIEGGIETASGLAVVNKSTAICKLTIPYEWTLAADPCAADGLLIAFAAGAVTPDGAAIRSTLQVDGFEPLPADGSTTKFAFKTAL